MPRRKDKFETTSTTSTIEKEEKNEKVNSVLNSLSNIKEIEKEIEKAKKLGYKEPKDYKPMSTDLAQEYMIALVKDKKEMVFVKIQKNDEYSQSKSNTCYIRT